MNNLVTIMNDPFIMHAPTADYAGYFGFGVLVCTMLVVICLIVNTNAAMHFMRLFFHGAMICTIVVAICLVAGIEKTTLFTILRIIGVIALAGTTLIVICLFVGNEKTEDEQRMDDEAQIRAIEEDHARRQARKAARIARRNARKHSEPSDHDE